MEPVVKTLKYATFIFDPIAKGFCVIPEESCDWGASEDAPNPYCYEATNEDGYKILFMNKTYAYSYMRFVLRFSQKALFTGRRKR